MNANATTADTLSPSDLPALPKRGRVARWSAGAVSGLVIAFLLFDVSIKLIRSPEAVTGTTQLGYRASVLVPLAIVELVCLALYLVPRTAPIGAILWTGYLGGAIATHVRLGNPLFSHVLFPIYVAAMLWFPLYVRDARVRGLLGRAAR